MNGPPGPPGGFTVELMDLAEVNLPMYDEPKHPRLRALREPADRGQPAVAGTGS